MEVGEDLSIVVPVVDHGLQLESFLEEVLGLELGRAVVVGVCWCSELGS